MPAVRGAGQPASRTGAPPRPVDNATANPPRSTRWAGSSHRSIGTPVRPSRALQPLRPRRRLRLTIPRIPDRRPEAPTAIITPILGRRRARARSGKAS